MNWIDYLYYTVKARKRDNATKKLTDRGYSKTVARYAGKNLLSADDSNLFIYNKILSGEPFMVCRWGGFELANVKKFDFPIYRPNNNNSAQTFGFLCQNAGFFPEDRSLLSKFVEIMKNSAANADFLGVWFRQFEDYYIRKFMDKDLRIGYIFDFEPWSSDKIHWSAALKGKKVLVIHPFAETIKVQYQKREEIFPQSDILPEFKLITMKSVQTAAGNKDERFNTWFDALDYMHQQTQKIDFDIAILGCGAYGMPLASMIKADGKQAIHLGGATQILFGIRGRRWDTEPDHEYIRKLYTDAWCYPSDFETPEGAKNVENSCYWK